MNISAKVIPPPAPPAQVVLTMDMELAQFLCALVGGISGNAKQPTLIYEALRAAGIPNDPCGLFFGSSDRGSYLRVDKQKVSA